MSALDSHVQAHLTRWGEFKQLAVDFDTNFVGRSDWSIVLRFYAVLHLVDAYLTARNPQYVPESHADRDDAIHDKINGLPKEARRAYFRLKGLSRDVRYEPEFRARPEDRAQVRSDMASVVLEVKKPLETLGYRVPLRASTLTPTNEIDKSRHTAARPIRHLLDGFGERV